jgi:hypothetical protein
MTLLIAILLMNHIGGWLDVQFARSEARALANFVSAGGPITSDQVMEGVHRDRGTFAQLLYRLRKKIEPMGWEIVQHRFRRYSLQEVA